MGTTLTNGLKLPDKGSVDWYADMQNNYAILDGAVGTIAEHTTALAGKAPLVHTHTKSDVTDLFNSANTWNKNNTYSADCIVYNSDNSGSVARLQLRNSKTEVLSTGNTSSNQSITFRDKNDFSFGYVYGTVQSNGVAVKIGANSKDSSDNTVNTELQILSFTNGNKAIFPATTNDYDLGISSYQWKSVQAQSYYYNGVAWGLDKANEWTGLNTFSSASNCVVSLKFGSSGTFTDIRHYDSNNSIYACLRSKVSELTLGLRYSSKSAWYDGASVNINNNGSVQIKAYDGTENWTVNFSPVGIYPSSNNALELGTSTAKWKTLNGVNPGALSLPDMGTTPDVNYFDFISTITHLDGTDNFYTPTVDGWMTVIIAGTALSLFEDASSATNHNQGSGISAAPVKGYCSATIPVHKNKRVKIQAIGTSIYMAQVRPCLGNV